MKRLHTLRLLALVLAILMLAGCGSEALESPIKDHAGTTGDPVANDTLPEATTTQAPPEKTQREKLYDYLFDTVIPQQGLAKLDSISWKHSERKGGVDCNASALKNAGGFGVVSAVVRDFDLDGNQELVVFRLTSAPQNEIWAPIFNTRHTWQSYVIAADLYTIAEGVISLSDQQPHLMTLDGLSWGYIQVSLEQLEDGIYIYSHSDAQDYNTYGASPVTIFHIAQGKFVFDYIGGIRYGQASTDRNEINQLMGTTGLKPREYTFGSIELDYQEVDPAGDERENRYVMHLKVEVDADTYEILTYSGTDFTGLRIIQEKGLDAFPHNPLPQGGKIPEDLTLKLYEPIGQDFIDHIIAQTGCELTDSYCTRSEASGEVSFTWRTKCKNGLLLRLNEDGSFHYIGLSTSEWKDLSAFMAIRDAIISYPKLGLDPQELAVFHGKVTSKYLNGYEVTGATVMMGIVADTMFRITYHS